jgi:amidase
VSELVGKMKAVLTRIAYPSATVPLGNLEDGSPYGLFLTARAGREDLIFRFMSAFEATFPKALGPRLE